MEPMELNDIQRASREQFGRQSHRYGKGHILEETQDIEAALPALGLPVAAKVLDVATGGGHTGIFFARLGHTVTVSDIAQPMLDRAVNLGRKLGVTLSSQLHPAERMPYPDASFDLVTCRVAPHHFSAPQDFVAESARVLKPGAFFLLIDGTVADDEPEAEQWLHQIEILRDPSHHRLVTPKHWASMGQDVGLEIVSSEIYPKEQPDLEWYFEAADTPPENRSRVRSLIDSASPAIRRFFQLQESDGKIRWTWQMLRLIARKPF